MLLDLYGPVVACPESCEGIIRNRHTDIPRGFFTDASVGDEITLLVVAQNPGGPQAAEVGLYGERPVRDAARAHLDFARHSFLGGGGTLFHSRLLEWLSDLLGTEESQVFRQVVYTNAVKCTTPGNGVPGATVASTCIRLHLRREIAAWKPQLIVALGSNTHKLLAGCGIAHECLPHPRHRRDEDYHRPQLEALRAKLKPRVPLRDRRREGGGT